MTTGATRHLGWAQPVVFLSLLLLFFTIPHTLEDFATGEPARAGVPAPLIALVVSVVFAAQGLALFFVGRDRRLGFLLHAAVGLFWPMAAGVAQLPSILAQGTYRAGFISVLYVGGVIVVGLLLLASAILALREG